LTFPQFPVSNTCCLARDRSAVLTLRRRYNGNPGEKEDGETNSRLENQEHRSEDRPLQQEQPASAPTQIIGANGANSETAAKVVNRRRSR
jgi:hypothetical protein